MLWGKKEDKRLLPDLPPLRSPQTGIKMEGYEDTHLEENEEDENLNEKHELPSFPDSLNNKGFSQAAIKDAVSSNIDNSGINPPLKYPASNGELERIFPESSPKYQAIEMEEWNPGVKKISMSPGPMANVDNNYTPSMASSLSIPNEKLQEPPEGFVFEKREEIPSRTAKNNDIFVKLDKFYSARKALFDTQGKLQEIDALLRKIRETKLREEQELSSWENELASIKNKINDVAINLFEKID